MPSQPSPGQICSQVSNNPILGHPILGSVITALALLLCLQLIGCRQQVSTASSIVQDGKSQAGTGQAEAGQAGTGQAGADQAGTVISSLNQANPASIVDNPQTLADRWIVSASEAQQMITKGATVLDARGQVGGNLLGGLFVKRLPGARTVDWRDFSPTETAIRGTLIAEDTVLTEKIRALGISNDKPVVVFGNPPNGWGEEGRIVWMLRSLGHTQVVMVDGGFQALTQTLTTAGTEIPSGTPSVTGDFTINRNQNWSIQQEALRTQLISEPPSENLVIIDTREPREFAGSTPYGEQRGGHIPGAVNLYFKDLLDADGKLLPQQTLLETFATLGITPETQVIVYCTGGIRSGWLAAVLVSVGLPAQNYAGSMWEWSASPAEAYPLETL